MSEGISTLHPDHLADLTQSGLTDATIRALGLHSARPSDIAKLVGFDPPGVTSALVFPYPGDNGFCRIKIFPPSRDRAGHTVKYLQRPKSGAHLYRPPQAAQILPDPTVPLAWTEGEKKAAKACQEGLPCLGLGGLWNWLTDGQPIAGLDTIAHVEREEMLYPDSDVWSRPELLKAVYALGKELEARGAIVRIAILPAGPHGEKWGLDDYLVAMERKGVPAHQSLGTLKGIPLKHPTFSRAAQWWKEWTGRREAEPVPDAVTVLERIGQPRFIHPAQDFVNGALSFGIPAGNQLLFVTSERKLFKAAQLPDGVQVDHRGFDLCRFSRGGIMRFLAGERITGPTLLRELTAFFHRFVIFRDGRLPLLLAAWTVGTYVYRIFRVFPYLVLRSPTRRCGKSRVLDLLALVAFNASPRTTNPTEAQVFRGPSKNGGTLLLDEIEHLRGEKETFQGLLAVLNSGFERGGAVQRLEKRGDRFMEISYPTYCPRALAGIARLAETLEDRSIIVFMSRKLKQEPVERFSPGRLEEEAQRLRDACYTWALTRAADLTEIYEGEFPELQALDDRARDLWEPLLAIAMLADAEADRLGTPKVSASTSERLASTLVTLAHHLSGVRDEGDTTTVKLIEALDAIVEAEGRDIYTPSELLELLRARNLEWVKSPKALAGLLNPLGLVSNWRWQGGKSARVYVVTPTLLADLKARYGGEAPSPSPPIAKRDV